MKVYLSILCQNDIRCRSLIGYKLARDKEHQTHPHPLKKKRGGREIGEIVNILH